MNDAPAAAAENINIAVPAIHRSPNDRSTPEEQLKISLMDGD